MFRKLTQSVGLLLGLAMAQQAGAFSLWGPLQAFQTPDLDYGLRFYYQNVQVFTGLGYIENGGTASALGYGSRLTTPVLTYAFDSTFLDYFGQQGVVAVNSAMQVLNNLPPASGADLAKFITDGNQQINYTAQALDMLDLKSTVMWLMLEHMGLFGETHVFDLQARYPTPITCDFEYYPINRTFDPVTHDPTFYVNGRLYGFDIWDGCSIGINVGDAVENTQDTTTTPFTAVATPQGLQLGGFYLGLTRDDMGGLQYLYKHNNYAFEALDSNTVATPFNSSWEPIGASNSIIGISNFTGVIGGVEKIFFQEVEFDSVYGTNIHPFSRQYTVPYVTNFTPAKLTVTRTFTAPDILFTAADLVVNAAPPNYNPLARTNGFILPGYVSPGGGVVPSTIGAPLLIILNNVGPVFYNISPVSLGGLDSQNYYEFPVFNWGSFDGSTNPPTIYPNGASLAELEQVVTSGAGLTMPISPWAPVGFPTNNTGTGGGGGGGLGGVKSPPLLHKKVPQL